MHWLRHQTLRRRETACNNWDWQRKKAIGRALLSRTNLASTFWLMLVTFDVIVTRIARNPNPEDLFSEQLLTPDGKAKYLSELSDTLVLVFGHKLYPRGKPRDVFWKVALRIKCGGSRDEAGIAILKGQNEKSKESHGRVGHTSMYYRCRNQSFINGHRTSDRDGNSPA